MEPRIKPSFWTNDELAGLDPLEKLAVLWAFTNPHIDILGMTKFSDRTYTFETGSPSEPLRRALKGLPLVLAFEKDTLWAKNFIYQQFGRGTLRSNNCFGAICKRLEDLKHKELQGLFLIHYPEVAAVWPDWRSHAPCKGAKRGGASQPPSNPLGRGLEGYNSPSPSPSLREGGAGGGEIPSEAEWLEACAIAGLPANVARSEWAYLGASNFQVRKGIPLTRANVRFQVQRAVEFWREKTQAQPKVPLRPETREKLQAELDDLRSEKSAATLDRRKEICALLANA